MKKTVHQHINVGQTIFAKVSAAGMDRPSAWAVVISAAKGASTNRRPHTVLVQVEPALSAEEIPHFDQPHLAVVVSPGIGEGWKSDARLDRHKQHRGTCREGEVASPAV